MVNKCVVVGCNLNYDSMRKKRRETPVEMLFVTMKMTRNELQLFIFQLITI